MSTLSPAALGAPSFQGGGLELVSRADMVAQVDREEGLASCGVGVDCP